MVTVQVAFLALSAVVTVIVAVPATTPVTLPLVTVAFAASDVDQITALLVASAGATVAVSVSLAPTAIDVVVLLIVTPDTETTLGLCRTSWCETE